MSSVRKSWSRLPAEHKDYFFIYLCAALWAATYYLITPVSTTEIISGVVISAWCGLAAVGAILALAGLIGRNNLLLERLGVSFIITAPFIYMLVQAGLIGYAIFDNENPVDYLGRIHLMLWGLWLFFFLNKRRRQLKARVKAVKKVPLDDERKSGETE